jgi:hypothetical protein
MLDADVASWSTRRPQEKPKSSFPACVNQFASTSTHHATATAIEIIHRWFPLLTALVNGAKEQIMVTAA